MRMIEPWKTFELMDSIEKNLWFGKEKQHDRTPTFNLLLCWSYSLFYAQQLNQRRNQLIWEGTG